MTSTAHPHQTTRTAPAPSTPVPMTAPISPAPRTPSPRANHVAHAGNYVGRQYAARRSAEAARRRADALARLTARRMPLPGDTPVVNEVASSAPVEPAAASPTCSCSAGADFPRPSLTAREVEVLRTWLKLDSKPAVAEALYISLGTVNTHLTRIRAKYAEIDRAAPTKAALVARAVQDGLVSLADL